MSQNYLRVHLHYILIFILVVYSSFSSSFLSPLLCLLVYGGISHSNYTVISHRVKHSAVIQRHIKNVGWSTLCPSDLPYIFKYDIFGS